MSNILFAKPESSLSLFELSELVELLGTVLLVSLLFLAFDWAYIGRKKYIWENYHKKNY